MPAKAPPRTPKGFRQPGSGRKPGTPNRITVEARALCSQLVNDPVYQSKLRKDFKVRRIHPTIESLVWTYHLGKPLQPVALQGGLTLDVNARLEEERRIFSQLDLSDLEQLAAESQALVDRAAALVKVRNDAGMASLPASIPQDVVVQAEPVEQPSESLAITAESDNGRYVSPDPADGGNE